MGSVSYRLIIRETRLCLTRFIPSLTIGGTGWLRDGLYGNRNKDVQELTEDIEHLQCVHVGLKPLTFIPSLIALNIRAMATELCAL